MFPDLLAALTKARVALLIAGLAWLFGVAPAWPARVGLAVLVLAALLLDAAIDEQKARTKAPPPAGYRTAA
ncbi:hypothetical protein [Streptomyces lavendofoliae]|uniref:Uncharacterized protein n=1 Tax=Streptomyces lavendofoliae TaxID=67314 RepID=A0A918HZZ5_9ACTN|nr:hypothetical protein [Streptomyces lavendofoliae]GGU52435.1 hypothetical protein GCM10010274_46700 [Streptomyces lavendofoliae]